MLTTRHHGCAFESGKPDLLLRLSGAFMESGVRDLREEGLLWTMPFECTSNVSGT
jgi:hypothetical protein